MIVVPLHVLKLFTHLFSRALLVFGLTRRRLARFILFLISHSLPFLSMDGYRRGVAPSSRDRIISLNGAASLPVPVATSTARIMTPRANASAQRPASAATATTTIASARAPAPAVSATVSATVSAAAQTAIVAGSVALCNISS